LLRVRGGADDAGADESEEDKPLNEEQITEKLNAVPTFVVMGEEGGFVALSLREGGRAICFFTEPEEAKAVLELTQNANADTPLRLACVGLGNALNLCNGFVNDPEVKAAFANFDGELKLQGPHQLVEEQASRLKEMLATKGMAESVWHLPVFLCEQLTGPSILPVFLHPRDIHSTWTAAGRPEEELPDKFVMMDIRMLTADMTGKNGMPWSKVRFVATKEAAELANELQQAAKLAAA